MDRFVIFYREPDWLTGLPCFDCRYGCQALPSGAVVVGIGSDDGRELLLPPYMSDCQSNDWQRVLEEARDKMFA